jgi:hypothetical protein
MPLPPRLPTIPRNEATDRPPRALTSPRSGPTTIEERVGELERWRGDAETEFQRIAEDIKSEVAGMNTATISHVETAIKGQGDAIEKLGVVANQTLTINREQTGILKDAREEMVKAREERLRRTAVEEHTAGQAARDERETKEKREEPPADDRRADRRRDHRHACRSHRRRGAFTEVFVAKLGDVAHALSPGP